MIKCLLFVRRQSLLVQQNLVQVQDLFYHHVDAMERLSDPWGKFSLSKSEGSRYQVRDEPGEEEYFIAARFFTRRTISAEAIARTFKLVWHTKKGFEVRDMGNHRVMFVFTNEEDVARVMQGKPWSFDKHLVALKLVEKNTPIQNVIFDRMSFWIQVHDIPIRSATMDMAKEIVSLAGEVVEDVVDEGQQDKYNFMRIRVTINLTKPLCRGRRITTARGGDGWVSFRYECFPLCVMAVECLLTMIENVRWGRDQEDHRAKVISSSDPGFVHQPRTHLRSL